MGRTFMSATPLLGHSPHNTGHASAFRSTLSLSPQDVVNTHPGLSFLKEASEFHSRYITTVSDRL